MKQFKNWILGVALAVVLTATASAMDFQKGKDAFESGDYLTALNILKPLAKNKDDKDQYAHYTHYAQYYFGLMYEKGKGVPQNKARADKWYRRAVEGFRPMAEVGDAKAQYYLGKMYRKGRGVAQDYVEAEKWYCFAAAAGHVDAQHEWRAVLFNLGFMYERGIGGAYDYAEALKWYRLAMKAGHIAAPYYLGRMYAEGRGVPKNYWEALKLMRKAASEGHAYAQNALGKMYADGLGVSKDKILAYVWFNLAAVQSIEEARESRDSEEKNMSLKQIVEAQEMSQQCFTPDYTYASKKCGRWRKKIWHQCPHFHHEMLPLYCCGSPEATL